MKQLLPVFALILAPVVPSFAATPATNVYEIEVVIFESRLSDLEGGERWRRDQDKSAAGDMTDAVSAGEKPSADSPLSAAAAALESSGQHRVLAHLRWQQSAEARSVSKPVRIHSAPGGLEGALRFYLSRFLLVDLNLTLREAAGGGIFGGSEKETLVHHLNEHRRVKTSETHYFDHPKFGALVRVIQTRKE